MTGAERVLGIGGCFLRARDPEALTVWYRDLLGIEDDARFGSVTDPERNRVELWQPA